jgi:predicted esterase YcpF (UPF0227 family)
MILYLHGFRSSPQSYKARMMRAHCAAHEKLDQFICPQLPASPAAAMHMIENIASQHAAQTLTVVGSSLGGYYATALAEQIGCKAVLLNPAVRPAQDLQNHIGELTTWHVHQTICFSNTQIWRFVSFATNNSCPNGSSPRVVPPMMHVWSDDPPCGPFVGTEGHGTTSCAAHAH